MTVALTTLLSLVGSQSQKGYLMLVCRQESFVLFDEIPKLVLPAEVVSQHPNVSAESVAHKTTAILSSEYR